MGRMRAVVKSAHRFNLFYRLSLQRLCSLSLAGRRIVLVVLLGCLALNTTINSTNFGYYYCCTYRT